MSTAETTDMAVRPAAAGDIFTSDGFATTMKICEALVKSGILPRGIDTPYKAFAIVQKGREIGVGPMRALTGIHLIEGKPVVSPELKLEQFRERGGRLRWVRSDNAIAELWLKAPNGDEHTETVTLADMQQAGVAGKDNWRKYPKSMLRARAVGFGLRALGEGDGSYTPDELGASVDESGNYTPPRDHERPGGGVPRVVLPARVAEEGYEAARVAELRDEDGPPPDDWPPPPDAVEVIDGRSGARTSEARATHKQTALIHMLAGKGQCEMSEAEYRAELKKRYGVDSASDISRGQATDFIQWLSKRAEAVKSGAQLGETESGVPTGASHDTGEAPRPEALAQLREQYKRIKFTRSGFASWLRAFFAVDDAAAMTADQVDTAYVMLAALQPGTLPNGGEMYQRVIADLRARGKLAPAPEAA